MSETVANPLTKTPIKVNKLGHLVYEVSDIERTTEFWTEILGFTVSDRNELGMVFLRSAADHHSIALVPSTKKARPPKVDSMEMLFRARDFLRERGIPLDFEGRRGPGGNTGLEFEDPDGYLFEIYCNMDQVGADNKTRPHEQFDRVHSLEDSASRPLPETY
jgi:catechol 2,3-dioxygenase-like lactoylglutathione lyase family enzyme